MAERKFVNGPMRDQGFAWFSAKQRHTIVMMTFTHPYPYAPLYVLLTDGRPVEFTNMTRTSLGHGTLWDDMIYLGEAERYITYDELRDVLIDNLTGRLAVV